MFFFCAVLLTTLCVYLVYLSNKNQTVIQTPLPRYVRFIALLLMCAGLALFAMQQSLIAAISSLVVVIMLSAAAIPLLQLFRGAQK